MEPTVLLSSREGLQAHALLTGRSHDPSLSALTFARDREAAQAAAVRRSTCSNRIDRIASQIGVMPSNTRIRGVAHLGYAAYGLKFIGTSINRSFLSLLAWQAAVVCDIISV